MYTQFSYPRGTYHRCNGGMLVRPDSTKALPPSAGLSVSATNKQNLIYFYFLSNVYDNQQFCNCWDILRNITVNLSVSLHYT